MIQKPNSTENAEIQAELIKISKELEINPLMWGMYYCAHHFRLQPALFHLKILKESLNNKYFAVAAPRGFAKSTILAFLHPLHCIYYQKKRFIVLCSNTFKKGAGHLETIKMELRENKKLTGKYKIKIRRDAEGDSIFRHPDGFETRFLCKGAEQIGSVRGEKFGAARPDLILIDDLEDDELVRNPQRRAELKEVFDEALIPAMDVETCNVIAIGTILHDDSLMAKLVSKEFYPEYKKLLYRARNERKGIMKSLWPEKMSVQVLNEMEKAKPEVFAKEMQNDPVSGAMRKFHREDFRYWSRENNYAVLYDQGNRAMAKYLFEDCVGAIGCDLAWEEKRSADQTVIMASLLTPNSELLIYKYIAERGMRPDKFAQYLFEMESNMKNLTNGLIRVGFEKAMLEKVTKWVLRQEMQKRNHYLVTKDVKWDNDKITRIDTTLQPRYANHSVFHQRNMGDLEHQLLRFPTGVHDDLLDAEVVATKLLQYPKSSKKAQEPDDKFMALRQFAIDAKNPKQSHQMFGQPRSVEIPSKICPI